MNSSTPQPPLRPGWPAAVAWAFVAIVCFHLAYTLPGWGALILVYPAALVLMTAFLPSRRSGFYGGLLLGLLLYGPQLEFFWGIFGPAALVLWLVLSLWIALFLLIGRSTLDRLGGQVGLLLLPFLWTGLEYFRSELYYLRFSWLNGAYALSGSPLEPIVGMLGMYGTGFASAAAGALFLRAPQRTHPALSAALAAVVTTGILSSGLPTRETHTVKVAGLQLEEAAVSDLPKELDRLLSQAPDTELVVLHEYLLEGRVTPPLLDWCRRNQRWLIIGGKVPLDTNRWQNTAFVVDPKGVVVFEQGKSVPIQFFDDGIPADSQKVWDSPWGRIGIAICYDLSYTRVIDPLIRQGAQALIIPTMDSISWGPHQHDLHSRVAPVRAREYGVGILRVASSGISQLVGPDGQVMASAPTPGPGAMIRGELPIVPAGHLPIDRLLAPASVAVAGGLGLIFGLFSRRKKGIFDTPGS